MNTLRFKKRPCHRVWCFTARAAVVVLIGNLSNVAVAKITPRHQALAQSVFDQLLAVIDRPEGYDAWPPRLVIVDDAFPNAHATFDLKILRKEGRKIPLILLHTGEIEKIAEFDPNALALTLGHELGHHALGHIISGVDRTTEIMTLVLSRQDELDADLFGMELVLKAGFSFQGAMKNLKNVLRHSNPYCSYEGLSATHPSWSDRIAFLDSSHEALWRSMSAFENGVFFLQAEQYSYAEFCFLRVTEEFPDCYEAWANLGYARVMRYCDALEPKDLEFFDVGQLVVGGFYARPRWLEGLIVSRGVDADLWFDMVGALREALRLKDDLVLAKANLAVAYLLCPKGKDIGRATQLFQEVATALEQNGPDVRNLDPLTRATLLLNSSVAQMGVSNERSQEIFAQAEQILNKLVSQNVVDRDSSSVFNAMRYNRALSLLESDVKRDRRDAVELLERYLTNMSPALAWWQVAYDRYDALCNELGVEALPQDRFTASNNRTKWRVITGVTLEGDLTIALSESITEIEQLLGAAEVVIPVVQGTNVRQVQYPERGISILASNVINAIVLSGEAAPKIIVRSSGLGSETHEIHIGMSREEFESIVGDDRPMQGIASAKELFYVYSEIGLAVRFRDGVVEELAIAPLARRAHRRG